MVKASRDAIVGTVASQPALGPKKRRWPTGGKKGGKGTTSQPVEKIHIQANKSSGSSKLEGHRSQRRSYHVVDEPILDIISPSR